MLSSRLLIQTAAASRSSVLLKSGFPLKPVSSSFKPVLSSAASFSMSSADNKNVAVVLSGCGVYDGTEVHEAAAVLAALTRNGCEPLIVAPDTKQAHVVDHTKGEEMAEERNVRLESARIARGSVTPLSDLKVEDVDAIIFPGGFGAAKNLSDFGFKGAEMTVNPEVEATLKSFHSAGKPIALCCIAPILAAKVFGAGGVRLTLGKQGDEAKWPFGGALDAAKSFGAEVIERSVDEVEVDEVNNIVTSPAFMYNGKFHEIQDGVTAMVDALVARIK